MTPQLGASTSACRERGKVKLSPSEAAREEASSLSSSNDVGRTFVGSNVAFLNVPDILHVRVTAQEFDDATKYDLFCENFFFLVRREKDPTEPVPARHVSTQSFFFFFSRLDAQHPAGNDHLSWSGTR